MGGAPCAKLLLNSGGVIGILHGLMNAVVNTTAEGQEISTALLTKGEDLICGFHKELQDFEREFLDEIKS